MCITLYFYFYFIKKFLARLKKIRFFYSLNGLKMAAEMPKEAPLAAGESDDATWTGQFRQSSTASEGAEFLTLDFSPNREVVHR